LNRKDSRRSPFRIAAFPFRGGKWLLALKLVKLIPPSRIYVEVFGGAASVLLTKPPSQIEVYNDVNGQLVNLFETFRNHPLLFLERCQHLLYSRQLYETWKCQLAADFHGADLDSVEAAVRTAYSITSSFTGDPTRGWAFDRSGTGGGSNRWTSIHDRISYVSKRLQRVSIDHLDFRDCIKNWDTPETLFFLDPPYYNGESGFYAFTSEDHRDLCALLGKTKGKWMLTYDDSDYIRQSYRGFHIQEISSVLSSQKVAQGGKRVRLKQIVIANFPLGVD